MEEERCPGEEKYSDTVQNRQ